MSLRSVGHDEHYQHVGLGSVLASAANAFSAAMIAAIIEPDIIIKTGTGRRVLEIDIDDILVWDCRKWIGRSDATVDITGGENLRQAAAAGVTKDNTVEGTAQPTSDATAQGTLPGGNGAAITGGAGGGAAQILTAGDEPPARYVARFEFFDNSDEEQSAVGQILTPVDNRIIEVENQRYRVDGNDAHLLLTAAHYHLWTEGTGLGAAETMALGMQARRMAIDVEELFFDRAVLTSILDALVVSS